MGLKPYFNFSFFVFSRRQGFKMINEYNIKISMRKIIKDQNGQGISKEELLIKLRNLFPISGIREDEFNEKLQQLFDDGEIYENTPNDILWL
jgi:hypothetical protein